MPISAACIVPHPPLIVPEVGDELSSFVYSVDVLSPAQPISDKSFLDVSRYGVIVTSGRKRGSDNFDNTRQK